MRRFKVKKLLLILLPLLMLSTVFAWCDNSYPYRKEINLTNTYGSSLIDYQVPINVTYEPTMSFDFSNATFCDDDDVTKINFWIEKKVDNGWAYTWVKVPQFDATDKVYMYYGNASATSESNGFNVFPLFDDFNRADNDSLSYWSEHHGAGDWSNSSVNNNNLFMENGGGDSWNYETIEHDTTFTLNNSRAIGYVYLNSSYQPTTNYAYGFAEPEGWCYCIQSGLSNAWDSCSNTICLGYLPHNGTDGYGRWQIMDKYGEPTFKDYGYQIPVNDTWYRVEGRFNATNSSLYLDYSRTPLIMVGRDTSINDSVYYYMQSVSNNEWSQPENGGHHFRYDNFFVASYFEPEPSYLFGSEESYSPPTTTTTTSTTTSTTSTTTTTTTARTTTTTVPLSTGGILGDIGSGVGGLFSGMSAPVTVLIILMAIGSAMGYIFSGIGKGW
jgi:hypothetical protein